MTGIWTGKAIVVPRGDHVHYSEKRFDWRLLFLYERHATIQILSMFLFTKNG